MPAMRRVKIISCMEGFQKNVVYVYNYTILNDYLAGQSIHPLNSANLSLISEVTLPRTVNASPPVAQTRVISCPRFTTY